LTRICGAELSIGTLAVITPVLGKTTFLSREGDIAVNPAVASAAEYATHFRGQAGLRNTASIVPPAS